MIQSVNKYHIYEIFASDGKFYYSIPKYQREYTWSYREWDALYDDISEHGHILKNALKWGLAYGIQAFSHIGGWLNNSHDTKWRQNGEFSYTLYNLLKDKCFTSFVKKVQTKDFQTDDVEALCNQLYKEDKLLYDEFESLVRKKYASLELPNGFTILDRLVLSLTPNDAIVSFNWMIWLYRLIKEWVSMFLRRCYRY